MGDRLPMALLKNTEPPASPLVEATLSLVHEMVRAKLGQLPESGAANRLAQANAMIEASDFSAIEQRILATGYRFAWSAGISADERPDAYKPRDGGNLADAGFSHPDAPQGEFGEDGRALSGVGDNVVRYEQDMTGTARFIRTNERVLGYLTDGVPPGTIAVIDDSGGTLTAPIIEKFAGVICAGGTVRSHLGILTREYNIPCVMNAKIAGIKDGDQVIIESTAAAKTTEDYQQGIERVARVWRLRREGEA